EGTSAYGILQSAGFLFFAFAGYARLATLGEEVIDPERTIPRAIVIALGITFVVYVVVGVSALAGAGGAGVRAAPAALGRAGAGGERFADRARRRERGFARRPLVAFGRRQPHDVRHGLEPPFAGRPRRGSSALPRASSRRARGGGNRGRHRVGGRRAFGDRVQ